MSTHRNKNLNLLSQKRRFAQRGQWRILSKMGSLVPETNWRSTKLMDDKTLFNKLLGMELPEARKLAKTCNYVLIAYKYNDAEIGIDLLGIKPGRLLVEVKHNKVVGVEKPPNNH